MLRHDVKAADVKLSALTQPLEVDREVVNDSKDESPAFQTLGNDGYGLILFLSPDLIMDTAVRCDQHFGACQFEW